jgi:hypothetical protein
MDIAANVTGIFFCLLLLTFLSFIPAAFLTSGIVIFGIANVAKSNLAETFPVAHGVFHFFAYSVFTAFWISNINLFFHKKLGKLLWLIIAGGIPICFVILVRISSSMLGREISFKDFIFPVAAIIIVVTVSYFKIFFITQTQQT